MTRKQLARLKPGTRIGCGFIEEGPSYTEQRDCRVARYMVGNFVKVDPGGMVIATFEHSNIEVSTVPEAVSLIRKRRRKTKSRN